MKDEIKIPDLEELYNEVRDYIKEKQGDKGYFMTWNPDAWFMHELELSDLISAWTISNIYEYVERRVYSVRVKDDRIELNITNDREKGIPKMPEEFWVDLKADTKSSLYEGAKIFLYEPTLFSLARNIQKYEQEE